MINELPGGLQPGHENGCPKCGSETFSQREITHNAYIFYGDFQQVDSELDDFEEMYCAGCGAEINEAESIKQRRIVLMK